MKQDINFYDFRNFRKKLLIINAISYENQKSSHYGYGQIIGFPFLMIYCLVLRKMELQNELSTVLIVSGGLFFLFGTQFILKILKSFAEAKYPFEIKAYRKELSINRVFWKYFACYYVLAFIFILVLI